MTHKIYASTKSMLVVGSIVALGLMMTNTAEAARGGNHNNNTPVVTPAKVSVVAQNSGTVINTTVVNSNTGGNSATGGNTGTAGNGGVITTGIAVTDALTVNAVNQNIIRVR